jgi:hypothetical protein
MKERRTRNRKSKGLREVLKLLIIKRFGGEARRKQELWISQTRSGTAECNNAKKVRTKAERSGGRGGKIIHKPGGAKRYHIAISFIPGRLVFD